MLFCTPHVKCVFVFWSQIIFCFLFVLANRNCDNSLIRFQKLCLKFLKKCSAVVLSGSVNNNVKSVMEFQDRLQEKCLWYWISVLLISALLYHQISIVLNFCVWDIFFFKIKKKISKKYFYSAITFEYYILKLIFPKTWINNFLLLLIEIFY